MSADDRVVVVSCDGHMSAPLEKYLPHLEAKYHPALEELKAENEVYLDVAAKPRRPKGESLRIFDTRGAIGEGQLGDNGEAGSFDVKVRLSELDAEGIAAEVIHYGDQCNITPFFGPTNNVYPDDVRFAGAKAHNRVMAEYAEQSGGRLGMVAEPGPCHDMDATLAEVQFAIDHGFVGVTLPGSPADPTLPGFHDRHWEPFWEVVADAGLVLSVHAGWGRPQGEFGAAFQMMNDMGIGELDFDALQDAMSGSGMEQLFLLDIGPRRPIWQLIVGGVLDLHPSLKLALTEIRADWVPATIERLDEMLTGGRIELAMKPSEYFARNFIVTPSSIHRSEIEMREKIGVDLMCFGADYPHYEGTWPNSRDWYRDAFAGLPEADARHILGENALRVYGFDRAAVEAAAQRIGPTIDEVIGGQPVAPELIEHFHKRSGYLRPADAVDTGAIDAALQEDLAAVGSR
jgi:predicted TIM-barrel fold metal-dependent hydrolase